MLSFLECCGLSCTMLYPNVLAFSNQILQENAHGLVQRLLYTLTESDSYGERRGAAFGLAGAVKGLGIVALKKYGVLDALKRGVESK